MFDHLGKRKFAVPIAILIVLACTFSLIFYPLANMQMKNLPFAIVCLDEGVSTTEGDVNLGNLVANKIVETTEEEGDDAPIAWTRLASQEELEAAMANNEFFGALVIPADFSQHQYDTLVDTMQEQIDEMQSTVKNEMGVSSGGLSLTSMGGGSANSASPALSAEALKMIAAAKGALAGATQNAQSAAAIFQQEQAATERAQQELGSAKAMLTQTETALIEVKTQRAELERQLADLKTNPTPSAEEQVQIARLTQQINDLTDTITKTQSSLEDAKTQVDERTAAVEKAQASAEAAKNNLAIAQGNMKSATINALGVEKTATASSMLATQASTLMNAVTILKDKLGNLDISERFSGMTDTIAAKALMNAAEKLEAGADDENDEGENSASKIIVFVNTAKSPMIANNMKPSLKAMFAEVGFAAEIVNIHDGTPEGATLASAEQAAQQSTDESSSSDDNSAGNPMGSAMSLQLLLLPTVLLSLVIGIILTRILDLKSAETRRERVRMIIKQFVLTAVLSGLSGLTAYGMYAVVTGGDGDFANLVLFLWAVSFALMLLASGFANIALGLGVLVAFCIIALGMMTGILPIQVLPMFWQEWVCPWAPQRAASEGIRAVLYLGEGWMNTQTATFGWIAIGGIVLSALALFMPKKTRAAIKMSDA